MNSSRAVMTTKQQECSIASNQACTNLFSELDNSDLSCASKRQVSAILQGVARLTDADPTLLLKYEAQ